jgi:membrane protease YdiL (CAAX protease family)
VNALTFLLQASGAYLLLQLAFLVLLRILPPPRMLNQVRRTAYISSANHAFFIVAGILSAIGDPVHAKVNTDGIWWTLPAGLILGFFYFVTVEVATRLSLKYSRQVIFDLQELAVSPVLPRNTIIPGLANYLILRPFGEELFFRAFMIGVLSTQMHWTTALLITVVFENLRYPQAAWLSRNTLRAVIPGLLFVVSPSIVLTLAMGLTAQALATLNQVSRIRRVVAANAAGISASYDDIGGVNTDSGGDDGAGSGGGESKSESVASDSIGE